MYIQVFAADTLFFKNLSSVFCLALIDYISSRIYNYSRHTHQRQSQKRNWSMKYKTEIRKKATKHKKQRNKNFQNKKKTSKKEKTKTKKRRKFQVKTIHSSGYVNSNEDSPFTRSMNAA